MTGMTGMTGSSYGTSGAPTSVDTRIIGNLGDLVATKGKPTEATATLTLPASSLGQLNGRAVVIHTGPNDPKAPDGAAGTPLACGVIGVANEMSSPMPTHDDSTSPVRSTPTTPPRPGDQDPTDDDATPSPR